MELIGTDGAHAVAGPASSPNSLPAAQAVLHLDWVVERVRSLAGANPEHPTSSLTFEKEKPGRWVIGTSTDPEVELLVRVVAGSDASQPRVIARAIDATDTLAYERSVNAEDLSVSAMGQWIARAVMNSSSNDVKCLDDAESLEVREDVVEDAVAHLKAVRDQFGLQGDADSITEALHESADLLSLGLTAAEIAEAGKAYLAGIPHPQNRG